jgi:hypothetical protein
MERISKAIKHEIAQLIPIWLFFFLAFSLLRLTQAMLLREQGLQLSTPSLVLVGSLIVAKAFLIMDVFRFMNRFDHRPIIYSTLWKSGIYWVGVVVVFYLEQLAELLLNHHTLTQAHQEMISRMGTPRFALAAVWVALLIFGFCATREVSRTIGKKRFIQIWFGPAMKVISNDSKKAA